MEPITHFLTGACIGRAGLNRKTAYATLAAVLAAEAADLDVLWGLAGPVEELKHHRGITHTFIAVPVVAAAAVGVVWLVHRWRERRIRKVVVAGPVDPDALQSAGNGRFSEEMGEKHPSGAKARGVFAGLMCGLKPAPFTTARPATKPRQPVHWGWLYLTALIAALSHLLLDWTNNYGLRPFFPSIRAGMRAVLCLLPSRCCGRCLFPAMVMPWLLGLADSEIGAQEETISRAGMGDLCADRDGFAVGLALGGAGTGADAGRKSAVATAPVKRMALEPYPDQSLSLARDSGDGGVLPDRRDQHAERGDCERPAAGRDLQAAGDRGHGGRQTHAAGAGLPGLGHVGGGARCGPGT